MKTTPVVTDGHLPAVSVVMPVYNAAAYLDASVGSILQQTLGNFEIVALDDGSSDDSYDRLLAFARTDERIRVFHSEQNLGPVGSSNFVVAQARAPIIARMDADDVSDPDRLRRQLEVLEADSRLAVVGCLSDGIDQKGERVRPRDRWRLVRQTHIAPFNHGSSMFRRSVFEEVGGYREPARGWEDQDLFMRIASRWKVAVLADVLYSYRYHSNSSTQVWSREQAERLAAMRAAELAAYKGGSLKAPGSKSMGSSLRVEGAMRLWAGERPDVFGEMWRHGSASFPALLWAGWAKIHPSSLRWMMRTFIRLRDLVATIWIRDGRVYQWEFSPTSRVHL